MKRRTLLPFVCLITAGSTMGLMTACSAPTPGPIPTPPADVMPLAAARSGEATLLLMADLRGVLRPCGCTVELQKGGFDRLIPYLAEERKQHPGAELVHAGPMFYEEATVDAKKKAQRERQAVVLADLVKRTGIAVAGASATDDVGSGGQLAALAARAGVQLTVANLSLAEGVGIAPSVVREIGGLRVGLFALADPEEAPGRATDPEQAASATVRALAGKADVVVLLSSLGLRETKRLVRKVAGIDFAVAGGMGEHPAYSDEAELVGGTRVLQFHREGRFIGRLTLRVIDGQRDFVDASAVSPAELALLEARIKRIEAALADLERTRAPTDPEIRSMSHHLATAKASRDHLVAKKVIIPADRSSFSFTLTPLDWDLPQDAEVAGLMKAFDEELARINIANAGTLPEPKPGEAVFVGTEACFDCHAETQDFWKKNEHAHAWESLEEQGKTFDADCVSCHVTGYGMAGGSLVGKTQGREDVQCEACHGPGSKHVEDSLPNSIVGKPTEASCVGCHNEHHSPRFEYKAYREHLLVPGHGRPLK